VCTDVVGVCVGCVGACEDVHGHAMAIVVVGVGVGRGVGGVTYCVAGYIVDEGCVVCCRFELWCYSCIWRVCVLVFVLLLLVVVVVVYHHQHTTTTYPAAPTRPTTTTPTTTTLTIPPTHQSQHAHHN